MFLKEHINGKDIKSSYDVNLEFYVEDLSRQSDITDIFGNPVIKKIVKDRKSLNQVRDSGIKCFESDIREDTKFLQNRYKSLNIKPDFDAFNVAYLDIEVESDSTFPRPEEAKWPINLISVYFSRSKQMFTFGNRPYNGQAPDNYFYCADEKRLLERFISVFRRQKVDIVTGWYVKGFDIKYIVNRCKRHKIQKFLSPFLPLDRIAPDKKTGDYDIPGISILDYRDLYKNKTFVPGNKESYTLQFISMYELNEGKLEFEGQIYDLYKTDWNLFVQYNRQDVMLVSKLENKLKLIELAINICYQALIPFEKIFSSVQVITGLILRKLKMKNMVIPDKRIKKGDSEEDEYDGGYVEAYPGEYRNVMSFDVTSMYPHMIMMYNISPETLVLHPSDLSQVIQTPVDGTFYLKNKKGILPEIVEEIFNDRKSFKKLKTQADKAGDRDLSKYYHDQQMTRKILINSIYGVLGNKYFHFYNIKNAEAVTLSGQHLIKHLSTSVNDYFKNWFHKNKRYFPVEPKEKIRKNICVYLDTDSNYLCLDEIKNLIAPNDEFLPWAKKFNEDFLVGFFSKVLDLYAKSFDVPQLINFKREKIISQQIILAKKHYICEVLEDVDSGEYPEPELVLVGIETNRSDVPRFCRDKIMEVIQHVLKTHDKESTTDLIKEVKKQFLVCKIEDIASPTGINDYDKYADQMIVKHTKFGGKQIIYPDHVPIHSRASINYNMLVEMKNLKVVPISNNSKIRHIYTSTDNILNQNVIGFVGNYPEEFKSLFKIDYELQFEKTFLAAVQRLYDVLLWGEIKFSKQKLSKFFT